jgi:hypothetical protein
MGKKSSPKPPAAPDPQKVADAQGQANREAILTSALVNRYDEVTPWGTVSWNRPQAQAPAQASGGTFNLKGNTYPMPAPNAASTTPGGSVSADDLSGWQRVTTLSPEMQRQFDQQNQMTEQLGGMALNRAGQIPTEQFNLGGLQSVDQMNTGGLPQMATGLNRGNLPQMATGLNTGQLPGMVSGLNTGQLPGMTSSLDTSGMPQLQRDYSADANQVERATFDRAMQLLNPQFDQRQRQLSTQLAVTGNPLGSEGYGGEMDRYDRMRNEAELAAALESVGRGRAEQSRLFGIDSAARGQLTQEQLASAGLGERARQQGIGEQVTGAQLAERARQQGVSEQLASAGLAQGARQQDISEQLAGAGLSQTARQQGINEQLQNIGLQERARQRGIDERLLERTQPMNELAAILQGSPAMQTPQTPAPAQYQMAPADITGAQQMAYQGALQNYATQANQAGAKKGGTSNLLGTLGAAAIGAWG